MDKGEHKQKLASLTREFISFLKEPENYETDISTASSKLKASKRRLYDVTNVLEGVGLIERCGKSKIKWTNRSPAVNDQDIMKKLENRNKELDDLIVYVDNKIDELMKSNDFQEHGWVSGKDVLDIIRAKYGDCDGPFALYAITGPSSMEMEVEYQAEQDNGYEIVCTSSDGPISLKEIGTIG